MLVFSKQRGRIVGCILAALLFLITLRSLDILRPYPELFNHSLENIAKEHEQELPYRPQAEAQESTSTKTGKNGDQEIQTGEPDEAFNPASIVEDTSTLPSSEIATRTAHHIFLEGTRKPDVESALPIGIPHASDQPPASSTMSTAKPFETAFKKTIVMGKLSSEDTDWVGGMKDWQHAIYTVDLGENDTSPTGFKTEVNKAKEATPYLTYIVEHYDDFPDVAVFIHAHRNGWPAAWHNDAKGYDAVNMLNQLKMQAVLDRGYVNLRCIGEPGCPAEINLNRDPPDQSKHAEIAYPYVYGDFFHITVEQVREQIPIVATPCCAQFAVSKEQALKRPKAEYERYLQLIKDSKYDDETLGTVMEYMWHLLFGQDAVHCENTNQCWKIVYGREEGWSNFGRLM